VLKPNVHIQLSKPNIIPDEITNQITYKVEEIKAMNSRMIDLFEAAMRVEPNDPELMVQCVLCRPLLQFCTSSKENMKYRWDYLNEHLSWIRVTTPFGIRWVLHWLISAH
jgi:hypothetical protein